MKALAFKKEIEVNTWDKTTPNVGEYGVLQGKIWQCVSSSGSGLEIVKTYERKKSGERLTLRAHNPTFKEVKLLVKPTGYIEL